MIVISPTGSGKTVIIPKLFKYKIMFKDIFKSFIMRYISRMPR